MKIAGILIAILVALLFGLCAFFQKVGLKEISEFSIKGMLKSKKWLIGILIGGIGALLYLYAIQKVEITILQPILNLSLVFPVILGRLILKEEITKKELVGIIIILIGVLIIGL